MTTSYYECHITMEGDPSIVHPMVEVMGWKFSSINGDIVLGNGRKCYATKHFNAKIPQEAVVHILMEAANDLTQCGIDVVRRKVERVIFDDRSAKVRPCDGACVECHLDDIRER